ncbi:MAG: (2Fe-2S) ferredoxin domain-containing protein [Hormoscilla sp. GM7CHS1pb]|nr:(2Fe-2S) ferredoxin domain-containing protein [Hormoscilla sp. GM7CHS1pb]
MTGFNRWVTALHKQTEERSPTNWNLVYEDFPHTIDVTGPLLYTLFQEQWQQVQIGHIVEGSVLELEFTSEPKLCVLYDGYLTVATEGWHLHLCLEEHLGGPLCKTPPELRQHRVVSRAALYRRKNPQGEPRMWGIQFWNGAGEKMMTLFLPNPYLGDGEDLLPESKPRQEKLQLYSQLRDIYVLGKSPIPFEDNPLKRPYLSVCRSSRCYPSRQWQPTFEALQSAVEKAGLDVQVITSGCLEVCRMGPVVFYSGDRTWYTRATPEVADRIVSEHLVKGEKLAKHLYSPAV